MPLQNRVLPTGEIVAAPWRGKMMGNRGILHGADKSLGQSRWRHKNWVACVTEFRGRWRAPMPEGRYTALFFWDEAAAFAAGHRPCAECRWQDYQRFKAAWAAAGLPAGSAREIDRHLHGDRVDRQRRHKRFTAMVEELPGGTFFLVPGQGRPVLRDHDGRFWDWRPEGYRACGTVLCGSVEVLTPRAVVESFRAGYRTGIDLP